MKCMMCDKKITEINSYLLDKESKERICSGCTREGYTKTCMEIIEHNKKVEKVQE